MRFPILAVVLAATSLPAQISPDASIALPVPAVSIPLIAFISGFDENGDGILVDGQPSNASAAPGVAGYSDMWQIRFAQVDERFKPGSYRDYGRAVADARAGRFELIDPGLVVNYPVMYVDGKPVAR